jgi:tRNA (adenine37-N6)-methyltransferase
VQRIGTVHRPDDPTSAEGEFFDPSTPSVIEIDERWEDGLQGIEEFSHLVVIWYQDRASRRRTAGEPRPPEGDDRYPAVGFFATRTPRRPNPIALSCPRLLERRGRFLTVSGLDAWDGTPVLEIKGYYPRNESRPDATVPDWLTSLWADHDATRGDSGSGD